jgi:hypothetical protein
MRIASTAGWVCWGMLRLAREVFLLGYVLLVFDAGLLCFFVCPFTYTAENADSASYKTNKTTA